MDLAVTIAGPLVGKLRESYNFPQDRAQETDFLKDIKKSFVRSHSKIMDSFESETSKTR